MSFKLIKVQLHRSLWRRPEVIDGVLLQGVRLLGRICPVYLGRNKPPSVLGRVHREERLQRVKFISHLQSRHRAELYLLVNRSCGQSQKLRIAALRDNSLDDFLAFSRRHFYVKGILLQHRVKLSNYLLPENDKMFGKNIQEEVINILLLLG